MMDIYNEIYDIVSSGDYSLIIRMIIIISSLSMIIGAFRFVLHSVGSYSADSDFDSGNDNDYKVDLTKDNNMFTKYYDDYDERG